MDSSGPNRDEKDEFAPVRHSFSGPVMASAARQVKEILS